ncbi:hypothetical protein BH10BAC5_BH10BAC5_29220 [soil metagenome]
MTILNAFFAGCLILFVSGSAFSQQVSFSTVTIDTVLTSKTDSVSFYLKNTTSKSMQVTATKTFSSSFFTRVNAFSVPANDSVKIWLLFHPNTNITYDNFIVFENNRFKNSIVYYIHAPGKFPDALYNFTQNLYDENLKTAIRTFTTTGYVTLGYNVARDKMYETIDDYDNNDTLECVYTGRRAYIPNRPGAGLVGFNCEHTWPQSFFGSQDPMVSDIFHLYPTDDIPNNQRSNYPFGIVVSGITYNVGGSKLGRDDLNAIVFEPRDVHKGNVARSLFYFAVKYGNQGGYMNQKQEDVLRLWNVTSPVDSKEIIRNDRIQSFLHVRNPFIDHPEFVDRIGSTFTVLPNAVRPKSGVSPLAVTFDTLRINDTASYYVSIFNSGRGDLNVLSVTSGSPNFIVESAPTVVPQSQMRYVKVKLQTTAANQTYTGQITIICSDGTNVVNLTGYSNGTSGVISLNEVPDSYALSQNYPNPFNPSTKINFALAKSSFAELKVFDLTGRVIKTLVSAQMPAGSYSVDFNAAEISSGAYIYKLLADGILIDSKKMILTK